MFPKLYIKILLCCLLLAVVSCGNVSASKKREKFSNKIAKDFYKKNAAFVDAAPSDFWWMEFNDEKLNELVAIALENNKDIQIASLSIVTAREVSGIKLSNLVPTASAGLSRQRFASPAFGPQGVRYDIFQATFDASWELDFFGKNFDRYKASKLRFLKESQLYKAASLRLVSEVAQNYINLRVAQNQVKNLAQIAAYRQQLSDIAIRKDQIGSGFKNETHQTQINLSSALTQLNETQANEEILQNRLAVLLGKTPEDLEKILGKTAKSDILLTPSKIVPVGLRSDMLLRRPDVVAAEYEVDAAGFEQRAQLKEFFPSFTFSARTGGASGRISGTTKNGNNLKDIRGGVSLPVFPITSLIAQYKISKAQTKAALFEFEKTVLLAIEECESQMVRYANSLKIEENTNLATQASRKILQIDEKKYELGAISDEMLLLSKIANLANEVQMLQRKSESLVNLVALHKAIGGGFEGYEMKFKKNRVQWVKPKNTKKNDQRKES